MCELDDFSAVQDALAEAGFTINEDTGLKCLPVTEIETSDEDADVNDKIIEALLDLDDVDAVYSQTIMSFIHSILSTRIEDTHSFSFCRSRGTRVRAARSESHPFPPGPSRVITLRRARSRRPLAPPHPVVRAAHALPRVLRHERSRRASLRRRPRCTRAGLFHEFRMGSRRRTLPPGDGLAHLGVSLIMLSALFSGLTLGLMSPDPVGLEICRGPTRMSDRQSHHKCVKMEIYCCARCCREHGGELVDFDSHGERDERVMGLIISTLSIVPGGDHAAGVVLETRLVHRGEDDLDHEDVHRPVVYHRVADIVSVGSNLWGDIGSFHTSEELSTWFACTWRSRRDRRSRG